MRGGEIAKRKSQDCRVCLISAQPQASEAIILQSVNGFVLSLYSL